MERKPRVGVLILHGMGDPKPTFAGGLISRVASALGDPARDVAFQGCHWGPILQAQQDRTWERLSPARMSLKPLRRQIVSALGDPASYLSGYLPGGRPAYLAVHSRVREMLALLESQVGAEAPLVVLAHSLGGLVASNYVWNEQRERGEVPVTGPSRTPEEAPAARHAIGRTPFERMETLTTLVTYGCNIPLFLPPAPPIECIAFPPPSLPPALRAVARWANVYDPDDLLGYPIADVWDEPHGTRIDDVAMEVGFPLLSSTPWSHVLYEEDGGFVDLVAGEIGAVLGALGKPRRRPAAG